MSEFISVTEASSMNANFRAIRESMLDASYQGNDMLPICETFEKSEVLTILNQTGCTGLRAYLGLNEAGQVNLVLVGVNENDEDMLDNSYVLERGIRCPEECPPRSSLNS